jgi:hypothetical protein
MIPFRWHYAVRGFWERLGLEPRIAALEAQGGASNLAELKKKLQTECPDYLAAKKAKEQAKEEERQQNAMVRKQICKQTADGPNKASGMTGSGAPRYLVESPEEREGE